MEAGTGIRRRFLVLDLAFAVTGQCAVRGGQRLVMDNLRAAPEGKIFLDGADREDIIFFIAGLCRCYRARTQAK
jgi:hypothetical protein